MFYILTCGSTASMWLSRVLCYHPEVVCFHGVKTIPATAKPDPSQPLARQFVRELGRLYWLSKGEKVFGAIHGFGHAEIAPEIAAIDGALAAMIRHSMTYTVPCGKTNDSWWTSHRMSRTLHPHSEPTFGNFTSCAGTP